MRKVFLFILVLLISGAALVFGGGRQQGQQSGSGSMVTEVNFFSLEEESAWQPLLDLFNKTHSNIRLTYTHNPGGWEEYVQKLTSLFAAGIPPDISWMGTAYVNQFSSRGQIVQLDDYIKRDLNMADYNRNIFEAVKINGKTFGLPSGIYTLIMFYNKKIFDAAGVPYPGTDWEAAWTVDEFIATARRLTKGSGPTKTYGFYANMHPERAVPFYFSAGGDVFNADHSVVTMNQNPVVDTYRMLQGFIKEGISPNMLQGRDPPNDELFKSDRLAMTIDGQWAMPNYSADPNFDFGIAPIPRGLAGADTVTFLDQYVICKNNSGKEEASWQAIKWFIERDAQELKVQNNLKGIPMYQPVLNARKDQMYTRLSTAEKNVFFQSMDHCRQMYFPPNWNEMVLTIQKTIDLIVLERVTVEEGMNIINSEVSALNAVNLR
jgi:ABC-type glycerol-3-phosphate transport system substrate-binding protein